MKSAVKKSGQGRLKILAGTGLRFDWNVPVFRSLPQIMRNFDDGTKQQVTVVSSSTPISGSVTISNPGSKPVPYDGISIELQGVIELNDDTGARLPFFSVARIVRANGVLSTTEQYAFDFTGSQLPCETINVPGAIFLIKFYLTATVKTKGFAGTDTRGDLEFAVVKYNPKPAELHPCHAEVGIEDSLQLELEYKNTFLDFTQDVLVGRVHFVLAAKKIEEMSLYFKRRELYKMNKTDLDFESSQWHEVYIYDIMEGAPTREEIIPIRVHLSNINLSPSFSTDIAKIEYVVVLAITDSDGKTYFKTTELMFYRGEPLK